MNKEYFSTNLKEEPFSIQLKENEPFTNGNSGASTCELTLESIGVDECDKSYHSFEDLRNKFINQVDDKEECKPKLIKAINKANEEIKQKRNEAMSMLNIGKLQNSRNNLNVLKEKEEASEELLKNTNIKSYVLLAAIIVLLIIELVLILIL